MAHPAATLVSVIIPTANRPALLRRAINSCLTGAFESVTEVIVVPNGPDRSWQTIRDDYREDVRVRFHYCEPADRDVARNTGMELARGEMLRFLDDDDFLLPAAAARQYDLMIRHPADFSSAGISVQDQDGRHLRDIFPPRVDSGLVAALSGSRLQIPFAHVYRRSSIGDLRWPVGLKQSEDIVWLVNYAAAKERSWVRLDEPAGVWYQHDAPRMSLDRSSGRVHEATAHALLAASATLQEQHRWTSGLATTVAVAIWDCVQRAFPFRPVYWSGMAVEATRLSKEAKPSHALFHSKAVSKIPPLLLLWMLLPARVLLVAIRAGKTVLGSRDYRRHL